MKKNFFLFSLVVVFVLGFLLLLDGVADARRMGGGRSFGSRPNYQRSYDRPAAPQRDAAQPGQVRPQQGSGQRTGGLFGGLGGMMGGLVMGSLIGSLLFGGGGFHGPGFLDILLIGGALFLLFRFLKARREATEAAGPMRFEGAGVDPYHGGSVDAGASRWGGLTSGTGPTLQDVPSIPPDFDVNEFLSGAKAAYNRLQDSWNRRDLDDIRHFTTPEVWEEIRRQAEEDPAPTRTEILLVKARLIEVKSAGEETLASVYFDVLMRESPDEERPKQVREVWHFSRKGSEAKSFWTLEGIQQLEE
ncbi:MAG: Tim44 domain-containing protein [Deltaproteobacteria bacterium]|nr:Tim44 domain-containing protein [Deltaproteobacteria bacterium]